MRCRVVLLLNVILVVAAAGQSPSAPKPLLHVRDGFELTVHAPLKSATALFGAHGERVWAGSEWDPHFFWPQPEQDKEGAVFTEGEDQTPWVMTAFDLEGGHVQYVFFVGRLLATVLDIHLAPLGPTETKVTVVYEWTALKPDANDHIQHMAEAHRRMAKHWETAINDALQKEKNKSE